MYIFTTGGAVTAVKDGDRIRVYSVEREALEMLVGGVELIKGEIGVPIHEDNHGRFQRYWVSLIPEDFANWVAHEALDQVRYESFAKEMEATGAPNWEKFARDLWYDTVGIRLRSEVSNEH